MKTYLCGKVTFLPIEEARAKFAKVKQQLIDGGLHPAHIVNPMEFGITEDYKHHEAMAVCLPKLDNCQAIYIQSDWHDSKGSREEIKHAIDNRIELFFEETNEMNELIKKYKTKTIIK